MPPTRRLERTWQSIVIFLAVIALWRAVNRMFSFLFLPADFWDVFYARHGLGTDVGDLRYARHAGLVVAHALPALLFIVLAPFQFVRHIRAQWLWLHRWSGRVCVLAGAIFGVAGLVLGFKTALGYGGPNETAAGTAMAAVLLFSLGMAVAHIKRREIALHREWMIRAFAMGLTAGTVTVVAALLGLSVVVRQSPREFIGVAFWLGFTINLIAAEAWINYTRPRLPSAPPARPFVSQLETEAVVRNQ